MDSPLGGFQASAFQWPIFDPNRFTSGSGVSTAANPLSSWITDPASAGAIPLGDMSSLTQTNPVMPSMSGMPQMGNGLGFNVPTAQLALAGLGTLGNLWGAFQAQKLAKKQFNFTKDITNTNLANQIKSYNTALADRGRSRAAMEGQSAAEAQAYIDQNSLSRNH